MAKFEVQARVIDLLGSQQIANCATAISELFKNAWDAYASEVGLDVYVEDDQAILWDNGVGMSESDLLTRWLVVGAAGKEQLISALEPPHGMAGRPIQGEKGIGRLAISSLGDTMLLVSRAYRQEDDSLPLVALVINWKIFRNEKLRLSDLEIPTLRFQDLHELETGILTVMVQDLRRTLESPRVDYAYQGLSGAAEREEVVRELETFRPDLGCLRRATRKWGGHGTLFYVGGLRPELKAYLKPKRELGPEADFDPRHELVQLLSNFENPFEADGRSSEEERNFRADVFRWDTSARQLVSLLQEGEAIGPEDLRVYDHRMDVKFDSTGGYEGSLEVYGKRVEIRSRPGDGRRKLACGPLHLKLWYFQGERSATRLDPELFSLMDGKLARFGGLMIYRDGLRVLPYGRPEDDWLRFEERRSKKADYYHFSYRRMFGYVSISRQQNPQLLDKSGREGLIGNAALRDLREVLIEFFKEIALRHFHKSEAFVEEKARLKEEHAKVDAERKRAAERRRVLRLEAEEKLRFISQRGPSQLKLLLEDSLREVKLLQEPDASDVAEVAMRFEDRVAQLRGRGRVVVPRTLSVARDRALKRVLFDHNEAFQAFDSQCEEASSQFQKEVHEIAPAGVADAAGVQRTIGKAGANAKSRVTKAFTSLNAELDRGVEGLKAGVEQINQQLQADVDGATAGAAEEGGAALQGALRALNRVAEDAERTLGEHQQRLAAYLGGYFGEARDELLAAQTAEIEALQEAVDQNLELVQLGLAVEIIDHDLNKLYRGIRASLERLTSRVRQDAPATRLVEELRASFQHMEQRYRLLSPLYRGSYRAKSVIDGNKILVFCRDYLDSTIRAIKAEVSASDRFKAFRIEEVPAVVLPVFINLVDNALYWVREQEERRVVFDLVGQVITVCDTGPGVHSTLMEEIFTPFFSTKPGGRGLGLYVARANLQRYGHEIWAANDQPYRALPGACFCVRFHDDAILSD